MPGQPRSSAPFTAAVVSGLERERRVERSCLPSAFDRSPSCFVYRSELWAEMANTAPQQLCPGIRTASQRRHRGADNAGEGRDFHPHQRRPLQQNASGPAAGRRDTLVHQRPAALRTGQVVPPHTGVGNFIPNVLV